MKIIFAGTPEFAVPTLESLINSSHDVIAVYTQPDRPAGRGQKLTASPVKTLALQYGIPVCQPTSLKNEQEQQLLKNWHADVMIVIAYGLIIPPAILAIPPYGCINVHASLLPRWRGAAPIQRAILAGDTETGITIMQMDEGLDTGDMLYKIVCPILPTDTTQSLHDRLAALGTNALLKTLINVENHQLIPEKQNSDLSCYAKKITKTESQIDWELPAEQIARQIRGYNPWPVAFSVLNGEFIKLWQADVIYQNTQAKPGTIIFVDKNSIHVATGREVLSLREIQLPNGKPLSVNAILNSRAEMFKVGNRFE